MKCDTRWMIGLAALAGSTLLAAAPLLAAPQDAVIAAIPANNAFAPIQSLLLPTTQQIAAGKVWLRQYLQTKAGAPITVAEMPEHEGYAWSASLYETAAQLPDAEKTSTLYQLMGQHLTTADAYLKNGYADTRLYGVGLALLASQCAGEKLGDWKLAAAINEAFLLPHLDDAPTQSWQELSLPTLLDHVAGSYAKNRDDAKQQLAYELWLSVEKRRNKQDFIRLQLAYLLDASKRYDEALKHLYDISARGDLRDARQLIPKIQATQRAAREKKLQDAEDEKAAQQTQNAQ